MQVAPPKKRPRNGAKPAGNAAEVDNSLDEQSDTVEDEREEGKVPQTPRKPGKNEVSVELSISPKKNQSPRKSMCPSE